MHRRIAVFFMLAVATAAVFLDGVIAQANASTALDAAFRPVLATPGVVRGIAPLPDGKVIVIGDFISVNGNSCKGIARLNADGTVDSSFQFTPEIAADRIMAVAVQADGKILIGGYLDYYGPTAFQRYLFRLNADGSRDAAFNAGGYDFNEKKSYGIDNLVRAIQIDANGKILVGGDFTAPRNHIARLNLDGSEDTAFDPGVGANGSVAHIALQSTGNIVIGGGFTTVFA